MRLQQKERTDHGGGGGNGKTNQRVTGTGRAVDPGCGAPRRGFATEAGFLRFLRLLPDAAPPCRHGNRRGVRRQEAAQLGGLSQGTGAESLPVLLRGATVRRVGAEARLGRAGLLRGQGQRWRGCQ